MRLQLQQEENREGNKNEDEENNNRRDDSRKTDPFDGASNNLLRSMRKEMDELKNVMREKMDKNLDGMVKRTDSPFTTKVLGCPLPPTQVRPLIALLEVHRRRKSQIRSGGGSWGHLR